MSEVACGGAVPKSVATVTEEGHQDETQAPQPAPVTSAAASPPTKSCKLWSVAYMGGTLDRCKERCSGDFNFVQNSPKEFKELGSVPGSEADSARDKVAAAPGLQGRTWYSTLLLFDEIYDFLMELGVLDTTASVAKRQASPSGDVSGQTPNAGWANRLLQTGLSVHETKTCGCFGGLHTPTVNTALAGNFHPGPAVEMLRGLRGDHGCQTKARMFFVTGKPIQPHEQFESHGVVAEKEWCPWPEILKHLLRLQWLDDPAKAVVELKREEDLTMDEIVFSEDGFFPNSDGWPYTLPDDVSTHLRFRKLEEDSCQAEWSMAMRDVAVPEEFRLDQAAQRLTQAFAKEHRLLKFSDEAKKLFKSYQAYFNILVAEARQDEDIGQGAQMGACPWKLAMLSAALMLWDISWEQQENLEASASSHIDIPASVVVRAFGLLEMLESIVSIMAANSHGGTSAFSSVASASELEKKRAASDEAELDAALKAQSLDRHWEPRAQHSGMFDQEVFRRLLEKAEEVSGEYVVKARAVYYIARRSDKLERSLALMDFRALAAGASSELVRFDAANDCMRFSLPTEPSPEFEKALLAHANISSGALRTALSETATRSKKKAKK